MQIVLVHGYFLKGTGSNIFVKNACKELCRMGHNVILFCQENYGDEIDFVESVFDFNEENDGLIEKHRKNTVYPGKCTLYRPNLNGLLPVFVYDKYSGYQVKAFTSCKEEEIEKYLEQNRKAIDFVVKGKEIDLVWSNHSIMQPVYVARSILGKGKCTRMVTVHDSCLNFSVRKSELLKKYAMEAIDNNDRISFVSKFSKNEFQEFFENNKGIEGKSVVIPAGVDLEVFVPLSNSNEKRKWIEDFLNDLDASMRVEAASENTEKSSWQTDMDIIDKIRTIDFEKEKVILYYGKYLWTKGVHVLVAAAPIIMLKWPNARFVLVGYGSSRGYFEELIDALDTNQRDRFIHLLKQPEAFDLEIEEEATKFFDTFIEKLKNPEFADAYFAIAEKKIKSTIIFTGFLKHEYLKTLIACADVTVAPSVFPEAFGLVAVESLAAGVIPVQTNHSGFAEVIGKYVEEFSDLFDERKLEQLCLNENLTLNIADCINELLEYYKEMDENEKQSMRERARKVSIDNYSWEAMVKKYLLLCR